MTLDAFLQSVGKAIAAARKNGSLKQTEAAERCGISYRYYQSIEAGKANITIRTLFRLAQCLSIHPLDLLPSRTTDSP
jgi:transcriptional regulator with XRE-family HTH domain